MIIVSAVVALSSTATAQPYIEIDVSGTLQNNETGDTYLPFGMRAVFDAGASPFAVGPNSVQFDAVMGEYIATNDLTTADDSNQAPFVIGSANTEYIPAVGASLTYFSSTSSYLLSFQTGTPGGNYSTEIRGTNSLFSLAMTSLPDLPEDYQANFGPPNFVDPRITVFTGDGFAFWNEISSGSDIILVKIRVVDGPPEPECIADLNNDGVLDFFDVSAYLQIFSDGCP